MKNLSLLFLSLMLSCPLFAQSFQSDCSHAILLCNNEPVTISNFQGIGKVAHEVGQNNCTGLPFPEENGIWLKWQIAEAGVLSFVVNPINPTDDIDFVVFEMPNGLAACQDKQAIRCVASGANLGGDPLSYQACTGATGLRDNEPDIAEVRGCITDDNNFARSIYANEGEYFALYLNNYGSTEGVVLEFTGSAQLGGDAIKHEIEVQPQALADGTAAFTFQNTATTLQSPDNHYEWNFGEYAVPSSAVGQGPHQVQFTVAGEHVIEERIQTPYGCTLTSQQTISVPQPQISIAPPAAEPAVSIVGQIYPNPVVHESQIAITSPKEQTARITIINQLGQNLRQYEVLLSKGPQTLPLDLSFLQKNLSLWVSLKIDGKVYTRKAVRMVERP